MNKIELMGRLTKDIEEKSTKDKKLFGTFTLAVPRKGNNETVDFIDCVVFSGLYEIMKKYVSKGLKIIVCGTLQTNIYENKDGQKIKTHYVIVDDFYFTEFKKEQDNKNALPNL